MSPDTAMHALAAAGAWTDKVLREILAKHREGSAARMYEMLGYSLGFLDAELVATESAPGGKRSRPALCLVIAEGYGAGEDAVPAAAAIELFHAFTLIHDDIEDGDESRRNKPTLWKAFGTSHAINAGDAALLIACDACAQAQPAVMRMLLAAFAEVIEGQYMDLELTSETIGSEAVSRARYMVSAEKKTGALFGAATEAAGMCAEQSDAECVRLRAYGRSLGIAFQLADDYRSVWRTQNETGKDEHSDIREHKRTLPFFAALEETTEKARLSELYSMDRKLSASEIAEAKRIIDATSARVSVLEEIRMYADNARTEAHALSLPQNTRELLVQIVDVLVPEAGLGSETV